MASQVRLITERVELLGPSEKIFLVVAEIFRQSGLFMILFLVTCDGIVTALTFYLYRDECHALWNETVAGVQFV